MYPSYHSNIPYIPLDGTDSNATLLDSESLDKNGFSVLATPAHATSSSLRFFLFSCVIALIISAFNSTLLSTMTTYQYFATSRPTRAPSVYMGLENLPANRNICRSRITFPKTFATFQDDTRDMTQVHAPGDKVTLSFGGKVRLLHSFCTLSLDIIPYLDLSPRRLLCS